MQPQRLLIATSNPGKAREVCAMLSQVPLEIVTLSEFPKIEPPEEHGATFAGNAREKAIYYARATGLWSLADDSGLEVDVLNGRPGVLSARYADPSADDQRNNDKLVRELAGVPLEARTARFVCCVSLAEGSRELAAAMGTVEGLIVDESRGDNGFGYDPHFHVPSLSMTMAQMPAEVKNRISHRGQALRRMEHELRRVLNERMVDGGCCRP